ncbi:general substrate transporter [Nitzschia inconspicua]|uniref:General substrate transporter n=1 Tax=Nitzschia inconspicua TaxID=303405 RepID=A0A9K3LS46_9STRA|nr:general substrate transporter [Nitzschia inconspicua]
MASTASYNVPNYGVSDRLHPVPSERRPRYGSSTLHESLKLVAGTAGNILEWYDFAAFGYLSDILGRVFFPNDQSVDTSVMESFAVFGAAFLMRPIGGLVIGYIGDVYGRKYALEISIFLMAAATTAMGCLPTYKQVGNSAIFLLLVVRMLQGLSVGGQLMSSLVFTLEGHSEKMWGLYGSFVMACANIGTFLGGVVAYGLRKSMTEEQLLAWGWRLPFLSGICISFCGIYLKYFCKDDEIMPAHHAPVQTMDEDDHDAHEDDDIPVVIDDHDRETLSDHHHPAVEESVPSTLPPSNPLRLAFSPLNRRSLIASSMVPLLWSGGFYLTFVWMAIYMKDLIDPPVPAAFGINSCSLLILAISFPLAGALSDRFGRRAVMSAGGVLYGLSGPIVIKVIGTFGSQNPMAAFGAQTGLGVALALWGAPMCAWLVESFEPDARLTSVSIGYNIAQAIGGGLSPFIATLLVDDVGMLAPGIVLVGLSVVSLTGLWCVAPGGAAHVNKRTIKQPLEDVLHEGDELEMKEIT